MSRPIDTDLSSLSPMHRLLVENFHQAIPHARDMNMRVLELRHAPACAVMAMDYRDEFLGDPQRGLIHTGVITTLIDGACGFAVLAGLEKMVSIATLDLRMDYLRPAMRGKALYARAECYRMTRHIAFVRASAWQDSEDLCVATSTSAFMLSSRRPKPADKSAA